LTVSATPVLHMPDEPIVRADGWLSVVLDGGDLEDVVTGADGIAAWFWARWRTLSSAGVSEEDFGQNVLGYRREIWLWLAGERTWSQCCSGLIGRVSRRIAGRDRTGV